MDNEHKLINTMEWDLLNKLIEEEKASVEEETQEVVVDIKSVE